MTYAIPVIDLENVQLEAVRVRDLTTSRGSVRGELGGPLCPG